MAKRISFTVHGKVQGVFFRDFAEKQASKYGLTGFAKNTSEGTVAGEAQGDDSALDKFKSALNEGSPQASVDKVDTKDIPTKDGESGFSA